MDLRVQSFPHAACPTRVSEIAETQSKTPPYVSNGESRLRICIDSSLVRLILSTFSNLTFHFVLMKREYLPIQVLPTWARLNGVTFHDVEIKRLQGEDGIDKGSAVVATGKKTSNTFVDGGKAVPDILITVPHDLVLSLELVETYAKSDRHLREVLDAVGDFARVSR